MRTSALTPPFLFFCADELLTSWLNTLNLTIDADFRLKHKEKGIANDPPLGDGWSHWVPINPYKEYVKRYGYQVEVSTSRYLRYHLLIPADLTA